MRLVTILMLLMATIGCIARIPKWDPDALISTASTDDLRIAASYGEPPAAGHSWSVQIINSDLYLDFVDYGNGGTYQKHLKLSANRIQEIRSAFATSNFFSLPEYAAGQCCYEDGASLKIWAAVDGQKGASAIEEPRLALDHPETKRFLNVWDAIFADFENHPKW